MFFLCNHAAYQSKLSLKMWNQTDKDCSKSCCKGVTFASLLRIQTLTAGSKKQQKLLFWIFSKSKIRSSHLNFLEQILMAAETYSFQNIFHFFLFWFSFQTSCRTQMTSCTFCDGIVRFLCEGWLAGGANVKEHWHYCLESSDLLFIKNLVGRSTLL